MENVRGMKEYSSWCAMKRRCYNKKDPRYKSYSAKGIVVCERWRNSFKTFLEDMGRAPTSDHSLGRIDNSGNYEPSNCRWETRSQQQRNTSRSFFVETPNGRVLAMDLAKSLGIRPKTLYERYYRRGQSAIDELFRS